MRTLHSSDLFPTNIFCKLYKIWLFVIIESIACDSIRTSSSQSIKNSENYSNLDNEHIYKEHASVKNNDNFSSNRLYVPDRIKNIEKGTNVREISEKNLITKNTIRSSKIKKTKIISTLLSKIQ